MSRSLFILLIIALTTNFKLQAGQYKPLKLKLPTINLGLIQGKPETFYMYVDRTTNGVTSRPWSGGKFGYWRTLKSTDAGLIPTKFHEGVDIAPVKRDSVGRPLDIVHSIAEGEVVYLNKIPSRSSYGNYVIIKHNWGYGDFYSLYAHLASINCTIGQKVRAESPIARLGYTGVGINLRRAHLHLELGIMIHKDFDKWHKKYYPTQQNFHGAHNGINLSGINIAGLFLSNHVNPNLTIPAFLKNTPVQYKVTIPRSERLDICRRYPWLRQGNHLSSSPSWEISFSDGAFPLSIKPSSLTVSKPTITYAKPLQFKQEYRSRYLVTGNSKSATLSKIGLRNIDLIAGTFLK